MGIPPKTRRICAQCEKPTTWKYDRVIGHSRCCECGGRFQARKQIIEVTN